jgi:hypothetical protein
LILLSGLEGWEIAESFGFTSFALLSFRLASIEFILL